LLDRYQQPVLVETFLPGREFTVGIVGTGKAARAIGSIEIVVRSDAEPRCTRTPTKKSARRWSSTGTSRTPIRSSRKRAHRARAWNALDCRDGGRVDIRCDVSANRCSSRSIRSGLHPTHSDLPMIDRDRHAYAELIRAIVESAATRISEARVRAPDRRTSRMNVLLLHDAVSPTARPDAQDTLNSGRSGSRGLIELGYAPEVLRSATISARAQPTAVASRPDPSLQPRRIARRVRCHRCCRSGHARRPRQSVPDRVRRALRIERQVRCEEIS
jgi:hypothetical protein